MNPILKRERYRDISKCKKRLETPKKERKRGRREGEREGGREEEREREEMRRVKKKGLLLEFKVVENSKLKTKKGPLDLANIFLFIISYSIFPAYLELFKLLNIPA